MAMRVISFLPDGVSGQVEPIVGAKRFLNNRLDHVPCRQRGSKKDYGVILAETGNMTRYVIAEAWIAG
jgi:hypothetical protein